jgi:hypothetical protein
MIRREGDKDDDATNSKQRGPYTLFVTALFAICGVPNAFSGNFERENLKTWVFSSPHPPNPSINHNIACDSHHEGTAIWFFQGSIFGEWKSGGFKSVLWIYGKRAS